MRKIEGTTVTTFQGDSFTLTFTDLQPGMNIFFEIRDKKYNKPVFEALSGIVDNEGEVTFDITAAMSDKLFVKPGENCTVYYYGIKLKEDNREDTILLGDNPQEEDRYLIRVLRKKAEG